MLCNKGDNFSRIVSALLVSKSLLKDRLLFKERICYMYMYLYKANSFL